MPKLPGEDGNKMPKLITMINKNEAKKGSEIPILFIIRKQQTASHIQTPNDKKAIGMRCFL